jgi:prevent-host-death family protein
MRIGVRDLKNRASQIIRDIRENRAEYVVTYHGQPVAVLMPLDKEWLEDETKRAVEATTPGEDIWAELEALREEIDQNWQSEKTAVALVSES